MGKKMLSAFLAGLMLFLMIPVTTVFGAAKVGETLVKPEEGWTRYSYKSPQITYSGKGWHEYGGIEFETVAKDAAFKFNFTGTSFRIISINYSTASDNISVIIDGKEAKTLSLKGPSDYTHRLKYEVTGLSDKEHSVQFINNKDNEFIILQGIDLPASAELKPFNPDIPFTEPVLDVTSVSDRVYLNEEFTVQLALNNVQNIYAEDFTIDYDKTRFQLVGFETTDKMMIVHHSDDPLRFITASKGKANGINGDGVLLHLKFKAIGLGKGKVDATKAKIADNGKTELTLATENVGEKTIEVIANANTDFSLKHLGQLAYYYEDDKSNLSTDLKDLLGQAGSIGDVDLNKLVQEILANPNYDLNK
ncbi:cohesin domain-containing protein [Paenibacillus alvei]|uniref:cohesin domain-containing protein n=1 Tax=Paenibacillus alvei TaxID=44250 RepID=UPI0022831BB6|nr:cohesin domain-containing protein [Paenibacillus alvei]MCY7487771.1 cohesin domain-containing protein [Paenibacillus alvei]